MSVYFSPKRKTNSVAAMLAPDAMRALYEVQAQVVMELCQNFVQTLATNGGGTLHIDSETLETLCSGSGGNVAGVVSSIMSQGIQRAAQNSGPQRKSKR